MVEDQGDQFARAIIFDERIEFTQIEQFQLFRLSSEQSDLQSIVSRETVGGRSTDTWTRGRNDRIDVERNEEMRTILFHFLQDLLERLFRIRSNLIEPEYFRPGPFRAEIVDVFDRTLASLTGEFNQTI